MYSFIKQFFIILVYNVRHQKLSPENAAVDETQVVHVHKQY